MNNETENEITEVPDTFTESAKATEKVDLPVEETADSDDISAIESIDLAMLKRILEGAVLAAGEPLPLDRMQALFDENEEPSKSLLRGALLELQADCLGRGYELVEVASGWRFQVRDEYAVWINRLWEEKPQKYSRALLETLALIAYRQPLTRGDIEEVRGVAVSSQIIKTLSERDWVKVIGHRDVPGRPALYATTRHFLDYFNLKSLDELPSLGELKDIDNLNQSLDFELAAAGVVDSDNESGQIPAIDEVSDEPQSNLDLSDEQLVSEVSVNHSDDDIADESESESEADDDNLFSDQQIANDELVEKGASHNEAQLTENLNESSAEGRTNNE